MLRRTIARSPSTRFAVREYRDGVLVRTHLHLMSHERAYAPDPSARSILPEAPLEPAPPHVQAIVSGTPKVGRNDPCPCGSGQKYKKCHG